MKKTYWFFAVLFIGCSGNKTKPMPEQLDAMFSQEFKENEPGGAVLVIMNGEPFSKKDMALLTSLQKKELLPTRYLMLARSARLLFPTPYYYWQLKVSSM